MIARCVAPTKGGERCSSLAIATSKFCAEHSERFKSLYLKYKNTEKTIEEVINNNEINKEASIKELLKIYSKLEFSYNQRLSYRNIAFTPETWDKGHEIRNEKLFKLMTECNKILEEKFTIEMQKKTEIKEKTEIKNNEIENNEIKNNETPREITEEIEEEYKKHKETHKKITNYEAVFDKLLKEISKKNQETQIKWYQKYQDLEKKFFSFFKLKYAENFFILYHALRYLDLFEKPKYRMESGKLVITETFLTPIMIVDLKSLKEKFIDKIILSLEVFLSEHCVGKVNNTGETLTENTKTILNLYENMKNKNLLYFRYTLEEKEEVYRNFGSVNNIFFSVIFYDCFENKRILLSTRTLKEMEEKTKKINYKVNFKVSKDKKFSGNNLKAYYFYCLEHDISNINIFNAFAKYPHYSIETEKIYNMMAFFVKKCVHEQGGICSYANSEEFSEKEFIFYTEVDFYRKNINKLFIYLISLVEMKIEDRIKILDPGYRFSQEVINKFKKLNPKYIELEKCIDF